MLPSENSAFVEIWRTKPGLKSSSFQKFQLLGKKEMDGTSLKTVAMLQLLLIIIWTYSVILRLSLNFHWSL